MIVSTRLVGLLLIGLLAAACSTTIISDSWSRKDYNGQIKNVYIIGIVKSDLNRMIFEDTFVSKLSSEGIKAAPSYIDLPKNQKADRETIIQKMKINDCDSVLLTRLVGQRIERVPSFYNTPYYNNWGNYYSRSVDNPVPLVILTVESVLYDLKTEELIWSARMETDKEENIEGMVQKFVDVVAKDLKGKRLI